MRPPEVIQVDPVARGWCSVLSIVDKTDEGGSGARGWMFRGFVNS